MVEPDVLYSCPVWWLTHIPPTTASPTVQSRPGAALLRAAASKGQGQFSCSHNHLGPDLLTSACTHPHHLMTDEWRDQPSQALALGAGSPVLSPNTCHHQGLAQLCCPDEVHGPLPGVLKLVRGRTSSPEFMTLWAASPTIGGGRGQHHLYTCVTPQQTTGRVSSPILTHLRVTPLYPNHNQDQFCYTAWERCKACSQGQFQVL